MTLDIPYCNLCGEPKTFAGSGGNMAWICAHCDSTRNCQGPPRCGGCKLAADTTFVYEPQGPFVPSSAEGVAFLGGAK